MFGVVEDKLFDLLTGTSSKYVDTLMTSVGPYIRNTE